MTDSFQWERCDASDGSCADIGGATSAAYTAVDADIGHMLKARGYRDAVLVGESAPFGPVQALDATVIEFGNFAHGDLREFADSTGANYPPSTGRTTVQLGGPNGGYFARLRIDDGSHLYGDNANNRIHLIGCAGYSNGAPPFINNGQDCAIGFSMRMPTIAGANLAYVYAGFEIHADNGTGPAPHGTPFQRGGDLWSIVRGGVETDGNFDSQWEFGPLRAAVDSRHHHQDWAGGNHAVTDDEWVHFREDIHFHTSAGSYKLQVAYGSDPTWHEVVPLKTGIPTSYPDKNGDGSPIYPMLSAYQQTGNGLQALDFGAGFLAPTAAARDARQNARLGF